VVLSRAPDEETALAIELGLLCKEYRVLPHAGGLLDQDPYHVLVLRAVASAQAEKAQRDSKKHK
jgi:hypothetical protein